MTGIGVGIKICGLTSVADATRCVDAGADAIGLNFWSGSPRRCDPEVAREIVRAVGDRARVVLVVVDATAEEIGQLRIATGARWAQLHGDEPPERVRALLPEAYKALRATGPEVVDLARSYPGEHILLDAAVPGRPGGTGQPFDWTLATRVAAERRLTLAGGLHAGNVAAAIETVRPYAVDVASGVESAPGKKDPARVRDFIAAVRAVQ